MRSPEPSARINIEHRTRGLPQLFQQLPEFCYGKHPALRTRSMGGSLTPFATLSCNQPQDSAVPRILLIKFLRLASV